MNPLLESSLGRRLAGAMAFALALISVSPAEARTLARQPYTMEILVDGAPLAEYAARGTTYIEALQGREYSVRLTNNTGGRVAIALSVDGLNSIDAKATTAKEASKWILDPWQSITIDGWQTAQSTARRFFFTSERGSYGAWLGDTRNLGVISAAVFRQRRVRPTPIVKENDSEGKMAPRSQSAVPSAPPAPEPQGGSRGDVRAEQQRELSDDLAATGIGEEVNHPVTRIAFDAERTPAAVLSVRYEYHDALVRLGVLPRPLPGCDDPLARRERARGFTDFGFAPDPYRRGCR